MPSSDKIQWPQGQPQFETHWRAISEGLAGNGIVGNGDLDVTATATDLEIQVSTGTVFYNGATSTLSSADTHTLSSGDSTYDRWDTVYYDTATDTSGVREGTAGSSPEPPDISGDEILLATIYVASSATNVTDSEILNWRTSSNDADNTYLKDNSSEFSSDTVESAFGEVIRESGDPLTGALDLSSFSGTAPLELGTNPGTFGAIVDEVVDSNSTQGTVHSYSFDIDGTSMVTLYAESDGAGGIQNAEVRFPQGSDVPHRAQTTTSQSISVDPASYDILYVDTANTGGSVTVTVEDGSSGDYLVVVDSGGNASSNNITVQPASGNLDGASDTTIDSNWGGLKVATDGTDWYSSGGGSGGGGTSYRTQTTTSQTVSIDPAKYDLLQVDTANTGGAVTVTVQTSSEGEYITIADIGGNASANNITVEPSSGYISGNNSEIITSNLAVMGLTTDGTDLFINYWYTDATLGLSELSDHDLDNNDLVDNANSTTIYNSGSQNINANVFASNVGASDLLLAPTYTSAPPSTTQGFVWIRTDSGMLKWYDGSKMRQTGRQH